MTDIVDNGCVTNLEFFCLLFIFNRHFYFMVQGGNMELKEWGKTMVMIQKYLERVTKAIDSLVYKRAMTSVFVNSKNLTEQSAYAVTNNLIELSERKIRLINLHTICSNALKGIDKNSAKLLILKFVDGLPSVEIASLLELSDRTYYRKLNEAYGSLENWLKRNNFTEEYFRTNFKNEGWIMDVFYKNMAEKEKKEGFVNDDFFNSVIKNLNKKPKRADSLSF